MIFRILFRIFYIFILRLSHKFWRFSASFPHYGNFLLTNSMVALERGKIFKGENYSRKSVSVTV